MLTTVALTGMFTLFALAGLIGWIDSRSQQTGWRHIARARREIFEDRRAIDEQMIALQLWAERLARRERSVRAREEAVEARERRLGPRDTEGPPAA